MVASTSLCICDFYVYVCELECVLVSDCSSFSVKKLVICLNVCLLLGSTTVVMYVKYYILQYVIIIRGMYVNYVKCM